MLPDMLLPEPLIDPPDIELPAPVVPPLIPLPELIVLLPAALMLFVTPPLVSLALTLSCRMPRMRRPERTDEVRVVDATLAVSPLELATVVWLARVTWRCVTVRGRRGTSELSCICVDGWAVDEPAVLPPAPVAGACGEVDWADAAAIGSIAASASVVMSLVMIGSSKVNTPAAEGAALWLRIADCVPRRTQ